MPDDLYRKNARLRMLYLILKPHQHQQPGTFWLINIKYLFTLSEYFLEAAINILQTIFAECLFWCDPAIHEISGFVSWVYF